MVRRTRPGLSRFRVRRCAPPRNDCLYQTSAAATRHRLLPVQAPCAPLRASGARRGSAGASMDSIVQPAATEQPSPLRNRLLLTVYTAAIFVSALLLFSVQPLFTKMVLPRLGGSPAVWSVAMVFFQSLLLAGYAYAHLLMQIKNRIVPVVVHLLLLIAAFATLPLGIASAYGEPPGSGYAIW